MIPPSTTSSVLTALEGSTPMLPKGTFLSAKPPSTNPNLLPKATPDPKSSLSSLRPKLGVGFVASKSQSMHESVDLVELGGK